MTRQRLLHGGNFLGWHIPGLIAALMPALELVEGPMAGTTGLGAKLAPLHAGDGVDFLEYLLAALFRFRAIYLYY